MDKNIRVQNGQINHRLFSFLLDLLVLFASTIGIYFAILYSVFGTNFNYISNKDKIDNIDNSYNLNLEYGFTYQAYEEVLLDFYFNQYPEEIKKEYNDYFKTDYSITHIYNISVLNLPAKPTNEYYKKNYHSYIQNENGLFDTEKVGFIIEGSGDRYQKDMADIYFTAYNHLKEKLSNYNEEYATLKMENEKSELISRCSAFLLSIFVFYIIIPFTNKYGSTLFEKIFKLGHANTKDGYLVKKYKLLLRPIIYFTLPLFAISIGSSSAIIIILLGFLFINFLMLLFGNDNYDLSDKILKICTCSIEESLLFKNDKEEEEYFKNEKSKEVNDKDFLNRLSEVKEFNLNVSRDQELKDKN